jgi:hypothetical protein
MGWQQHLQTQRRIDRYNASLWARIIEAKLKVALTPEEWAEIEAKWDAEDDLDAYLPQQRRDFLVSEADRLGRLDLVPLEAL